MIVKVPVQNVKAIGAPAGAAAFLFWGSKLLTHHWCGPSVDDIALVHIACNVHDGQGRCGMDGLIQGLKKLPGAILRQLPIRCEALF